MRAAVTVIFFVVVGVVVDACSSNSLDDGCYNDSDCSSGYLCDDSIGACYAASGGSGNSQVCSAPSDCPASYTCGKESRCLPGDCFFHGCVTGFECQSSTGVWQCAPTSDGSAAGASGNEDNSAAGTGGVMEAAGQGG